MAIDPRLSEQLQAEIQRAVATAVEPLQHKLDQQEEWASGLFLAMLGLLQATAKEQPAVIRRLVPEWEKVAERYELAHRGLYQDESPERLEPRKMLYRMLLTTGALRHLDGISGTVH